MDQAIHVVCPGCSGVNRVPAARLDAGPVCGRCHAGLFLRHPVELTSATFDTQVGRSDLPVVVDFWAPWCGPCKMMAPAFERAAAELEPRVRLAKVNTEAEPGLAARFGIRAIPTLVAFRGGREIGRHSGALGHGGLVSWSRTTCGG
ncbi:MAG: thioredoxin TrxC [Candidatus Methylomirabilia bacterium]